MVHVQPDLSRTAVRFAHPPVVRIAGRVAMLLLAGLMMGGCGNGSNSSSAGTDAGAAAAPVAAAPATAQGKTDALDSELAAKSLESIDAIRAVGRNCGGISFAAAAPVSWDGRIETSAVAHAQYMASNDSLTHTGSGGSSVGQRLTMAGFDWSAVGENIAFGHDSVAEVFQGWVDSPGHCANLMNPGYQTIGVARVDEGTESYWAIVLARPRS